ncbi:MAG: fibrobacter succinogenes major paralogous domain-containing protein [Bacteroidales bacterium]|nr:fibrobacter succinogenes major paralogous domain-containing protein [Bacteroidales bacterium]
MKTFSYLYLLILLSISFNLQSQISASENQSDSIQLIKTTTIGPQVWMTENLDVSSFSNGVQIPEATSNEDWYNLGLQKQPAWCYYESSTENGLKYGKLYNWFAVSDTQNICPTGFHIPADYEWEQLVLFLGGENEAGLKLKSLNLWDEDGNGSDEIKFDGRPGGHRNSGGAFGDAGSYGYWWGANSINNDYAFGVNLNNKSNAIFRGRLGKAEGYSVRCVKN